MSSDELVDKDIN